MQKLNAPTETSPPAWALARPRALLSLTVALLNPWWSQALTCLAWTGPWVAAQATPLPSPSPKTQTYQIPQGTLDQVLNRFAAMANISLSVDASLTAGQRSAGLHGTYSLEQGLSEVLKDTNLQAQKNQPRVYSLHPVKAITAEASDGDLPAVQVSASALLTGTTEGGARNKTPALTVLNHTQSLRRTPLSATVVSHGMLQQQALEDVQQALTQVATGVTMHYHDSERISYYARGYEIDGFQINGLPTYRSGAAMLKTDTATLDRIEVTLGAAGLVRGAGHPSASVNMVQKRPTPQRQGLASVTMGAWGKRRAELDLSGPINASGSLRARVVMAAENTQLFQTARHDNHRVLYGVVQAELSPRNQLTASLGYSRQNATGAWGNLPAASDGTQLGLARNTFLGAAWNAWNRERKEGFVEFEHFYDNDWKLTASALHSDTQLKKFQQSYFTPHPQNPYSGTMNASIYKDAGVYQTAISLNANGPFTLFGRQHELILGAQTHRVRDSRFGIGWPEMNPVAVPDIRQWNPYTDIPLPIAQGLPQGSGGSTIDQNGLYVSARIALTQKLLATAGARISWWRYQSASNPAQNYSIHREVLPYYGLVYDLNDAWSLYASHSEIFTPQRAFDAQGQVLPPIRGKTAEAGIKGALMNGQLNALVSVFHTDHVGKGIDDTSTGPYCQPEAPSGYCQLPEGKTRAQGFEAQLQGQITPQWSLSAGYTNTRTRRIRDNDADKVGSALRPLDPRQILRLFTSYHLHGAWRGLTVGTGAQIQSQRHATTEGVTYHQSGLGVYSAMARYQFSPSTAVQLNVNNLFDKVYYAQVGGGINNYYGEPRQWQLTLNTRF